MVKPVQIQQPSKSAVTKTVLDFTVNSIGVASIGVTCYMLAKKYLARFQSEPEAESNDSDQQSSSEKEVARPDEAVLRRALAARLPATMCPAAYLFLDRLPTTSGGKLDRQALLKRASGTAARWARASSGPRRRAPCSWAC